MTALAFPAHHTRPPTSWLGIDWHGWTGCLAWGIANLRLRSRA